MRAVVAVVIACVVVAIGLFALTSSIAGDAAGYALMGIAAVLAVSAAFYAVGRSEDRERAERAAAERAADD